MFWGVSCLLRDDWASLQTCAPLVFIPCLIVLSVSESAAQRCITVGAPHWLITGRSFFPPLLLTCWVMSSQCNLTLSSAFSRSQPFTPLMYYRWPRRNWGNPAGRELIYSNPILGELNQSQQFSHGDGVANLTVPNTVPVNKAVTKARLKIVLFWLCWYFLAQLISSLRWSWIVLSINASKQQSHFSLFLNGCHSQAYKCKEKSKEVELLQIKGCCERSMPLLIDPVGSSQSSTQRLFLTVKIIIIVTLLWKI